MRIILIALLPALLAAEDAPAGPPPPRRGWDISLGAMGLAAPASPGSDQQSRRVLPFLKASYDRKLFIGSNPAVLGLGLAVRALEKGPLSWDFGVGYMEGRKESLANVLAGMGNQTGSIWAGTAVHYRLGPLEMGIAGAHGLYGEAGNRFKLNLGSHLPLGPRWLMGAQASLGISDSKGMAYEFGVDSTQAAKRQAMIAAGDTRLRGDEGREYHPGGGLRDAGLGLMLGYQLGRGWGLMGTVNASHLMKNAADSPLVRKQNTVSAGMGINYHF
ncbi:MipA/OmpV family protein [Holophaga foetida]|uniref:MipA/OmpV family protein n=1 Tax=Holophaga foetida TaxID=35839 RepID=UPI0002474293|nr:MipA/OmpV family protein [Holophaga foetida]